MIHVMSPDEEEGSAVRHATMSEAAMRHAYMEKVLPMDGHHPMPKPKTSPMSEALAHAKTPMLAKVVHEIAQHLKASDPLQNKKKKTNTLPKRRFPNGIFGYKKPSNHKSKKRPQQVQEQLPQWKLHVRSSMG